VEKIKPHALRLTNSFRKSCIFFNVEKNILKPDRPQMIIWCMRTACWIAKGSNHFRNIKYLLFFSQTWLHSSSSTYVHCEFYFILFFFPQKCKLCLSDMLIGLLRDESRENNLWCITFLLFPQCNTVRHLTLPVLKVG
jgi:hypothetical protein